MIHLPTPDPLGAVVSATTAGHAQLSDEVPAAPRPSTTAATGPLIDMDALRKAVTKR